MKISAADYTARIEVRYAETDAMGVVHHAFYAVWLEQARVEAMRAHGCPYDEIEKSGFSSPVIEMNTQFLHSCRFGDFVDVHVTVARVDKLRVQFFYELSVNGKLCAKAFTLHLFTKIATGMPCRKLPQEFARAFFPEELEG